MRSILTNAIVVSLVAGVLAFAGPPTSTEAAGSGPTYVSGDLSTDAVWGPAGSPYVIEKYLSIPSGVTLTVLPGTVVKFKRDNLSRMYVEGRLLALGTGAERVVFTSIKDDSVGGDTNGDGTATSPSAGDWDSIHFRGEPWYTVSDERVSVLDHVDIRYGGYGSAIYCQTYASVVVDAGRRVVINEGSITDSHKIGIQIRDGAEALVANSTFERSLCGVQGAAGPSWETPSPSLSGVRGDSSIRRRWSSSGTPSGGGSG